MERLGWDEYFMNIAEVVAKRSNCLTRQIGAVLVRDKQILSTGYNGTPRGIKNCNEGGCLRCLKRTEETSGMGLDYCICCHAEENAIVQAALHGIATENTILYTTLFPCTTCAKILINAGVRKVIAKTEYKIEQAIELLYQAAIKVVILSPASQMPSRPMTDEKMPASNVQEEKSIASEKRDEENQTPRF